MQLANQSALPTGYRGRRSPFDRGSAISCTPVPAETTLLANSMNHTPTYQITNACYAVFIDEQPTHDFAHGLHLFLVDDQDAKVAKTNKFDVSACEETTSGKLGVLGVLAVKTRLMWCFRKRPCQVAGH